MSDRHLRLLRAVARRRQDDAATPGRDDDAAADATPRGRERKRVAARTRARLGAAEARRRQARDD